MTGASLFKRYLALLGVEAAPPSLDHLRRLVRAQLTRVPFENVSKLWLKKQNGAATIPSLEQHLDGIERHNFGGTCYANNPYFCQLLRHLGYEADLCGADMSRPDVHVVSIVRLQGREYLVDVGYGAPFFEPMPRDLDHELEILWGQNQYVLHPRDAQGRSRMDQHRDGSLIHGYTANPTARDIGHFEQVVRDSYSGTATFMNVLVVERFFEDRSVRIHNFVLTESTRDHTKTTHLKGREELAGAIEDRIGISRACVREAIDDIALAGDIYT